MGSYEEKCRRICLVEEKCGGFNTVNGHCMFYRSSAQNVHGVENENGKYECQIKREAPVPTPTEEPKGEHPKGSSGITNYTTSTGEYHFVESKGRCQAGPYGMNPYEYIQPISAEDCQKVCLNDEKCETFNFFDVRYGDDASKEPMCQLYDKEQTRGRQDVSGEGSNYAGICHVKKEGLYVPPFEVDYSVWSKMQGFC